MLLRGITLTAVAIAVFVPFDIITRPDKSRRQAAMFCGFKWLLWRIVGWLIVCARTAGA
jgi:hypothetical protein